MTRAVLLDALGTLVELPPPAPALVEELGRRGVTVTEDEAAHAIGAEIAFYRAHLDEARDAAGLADLRARCTEVLREALPAHARDVDDLEDVLLGALRFRPYPEVPQALAALRDAGAKLVVVSNWDVSLHEVLERTGLAPLVDGAISSAEHGAAKPDRSIFDAALELVGAQPGEALHCGDSVEADVEGARAAGIVPILIARDGTPAPDGVRRITSLSSLVLALSSSTWDLQPERPGTPPPPTPGPEPASGERAWVPWGAPIALVAALFVAIIGGLVIGGIAAAFGADLEDLPPGVLMAATLVQDAGFVAAAVFFARSTGPVGAELFGFRPTNILRAIGIIVGLYVGYIVFVAVWSTLIDIGSSEDQLEDLGVEESDALRVAGALLVCVVAPVVEEFFFRGFFFASLRNWKGYWLAAILTGAIFGAIHLSSVELAAVVPLAVLGFGLCLLYQWTGSLYPCIAVHAINNSIAFGVGVHWGWEIPLLTLGSLAACAAVSVPIQRRWRVSKASIAGTSNTVSPPQAP